MSPVSSQPDLWLGEVLVLSWAKEKVRTEISSQQVRRSECYAVKTLHFIVKLLLFRHLWIPRHLPPPPHSSSSSLTPWLLQDPGRDGDGWKPSQPGPGRCQRSALPRHKRYGSCSASNAALTHAKRSTVPPFRQARSPSSWSGTLHNIRHSSESWRSS